MDAHTYHLGCERTTLAFRVEPGESVSVGRSSQANIRLAHRSASKLHFRLSNRDGHLLLKELLPRQFMVLNDARFPPGGTRELSPGDRLAFVEYELVVEVIPPGRAPEGPPA